MIISKDSVILNINCKILKKMKNKLTSFKSLLIFTLIILICFLVVKFKTNVLPLSLSKLPLANQSNLKGTGCIYNVDKLSKEYIYKFNLGDDLAATASFRESGGGKNNVLSSYSLEQYLPEIGDQGDVGSCVGWATTYYGLTIVKRIEHNKNYPEFSPLSVFNRFSYRNKLNPCEGGAYIDECLSLLVTKGCPYLKQYDKPNCSIDASKQKYKDCLSNFQRLQQNNALQMKMALTNNCPVIIAMDVFEGGKGNSLNSKFLDSNGIIKIENFRNNKYRGGGHALCIVGYDDNVGGGAFKIVNSWGKKWGKSGFCWLRYSDLDILRCAYFMEPDVSMVNTETTNFKTSFVEVSNTSSKNFYVAIGMNMSKGKHSKGWFFIQAGETRKISIQERSKNDVYYLLMDEQGKVFEQPSSSPSQKFDLSKNAYFDLASNDNVKDVEQKKFARITPSNKKRTQFLIITGALNPKIQNE